MLWDCRSRDSFVAMLELIAEFLASTPAFGAGFLAGLIAGVLAAKFGASNMVAGFVGIGAFLVTSGV
jgi:hypothetical protein